MTKDYEADSIADETRRDVERRMQSPYTRAEFVAREVEAGIDAQGVPGVDVDFCDLDPDAATAIRQRAEWNAQAAERAGITWRQESATDKPLVDWLADRVDDLEVSHKEQAERIAGLVRRENLHVQAIGELSGRMRAAETEIVGLNNGQLAVIDVEQRQVKLRHELADRVAALERSSSALRDRVLGSYEIDDNDEYTPVLDRLDGLANRMSTANARITATEKAVRGLEQQVAQTPQPIVAEIRDQTGARTIYHAIEEHAKNEIRMLIREEIGGLTEEVIQPACETIGEHDRRLSLQLERITELTNKMDLLSAKVNSAQTQITDLYDNTEGLCGMLDVVRRLDADMALVRDALGVVPAVEQQPAPTFKCAGRYCPGLPYPPSERIHPESCVARTPFTFDDWWTHFTSAGIYLGNGINVDRESTTGNALYRYLRQTWNAAQGRASIQAAEGGTTQQDDDDP